MNTSVEQVRMIQSDTDRTGYDTGPFASTGTPVAGKAVLLASEGLRDKILAFASEHLGVPRDKCCLEHDAVACQEKRVTLGELATAARKAGRSLEIVLHKRFYGTPRSVGVPQFTPFASRSTGSPPKSSSSKVCTRPMPASF